MNKTKNTKKAQKKKESMTHARSRLLCVLDSASSAPLITTTVAQHSSEASFLLCASIPLTASISPRVHCSVGSYRCPPGAPTLHYVSANESIFNFSKITRSAADTVHTIQEALHANRQLRLNHSDSLVSSSKSSPTEAAGAKLTCARRSTLPVFSLDTSF